MDWLRLASIREKEGDAEEEEKAETGKKSKQTGQFSTVKYNNLQNNTVLIGCRIKKRLRL